MGQSVVMATMSSRVSSFRTGPQNFHLLYPHPIPGPEYNDAVTIALGVATYFDSIKRYDRIPWVNVIHSQSLSVSALCKRTVSRSVGAKDQGNIS